ncbi:hypothetical protein IJM86_08260 [bacterium]|nr:hypothetical protein [bacterium]
MEEIHELLDQILQLEETLEMEILDQQVDQNDLLIILEIQIPLEIQTLEMEKLHEIQEELMILQTERELQEKIQLLKMPLREILKKKKMLILRRRKQLQQRIKLRRRTLQKRKKLKTENKTQLQKIKQNLKPISLLDLFLILGLQNKLKLQQLEQQQQENELEQLH